VKALDVMGTQIARVRILLRAALAPSTRRGDGRRKERS